MNHDTETKTLKPKCEHAKHVKIARNSRNAEVPLSIWGLEVGSIDQCLCQMSTWSRAPQRRWVAFVGSLNHQRQKWNRSDILGQESADSPAPPLPEYFWKEIFLGCYCQSRRQWVVKSIKIGKQKPGCSNWSKTCQSGMSTWCHLPGLPPTEENFHIRPFPAYSVGGWFALSAYQSPIPSWLHSFRPSFSLYLHIMPSPAGCAGGWSLLSTSQSGISACFHTRLPSTVSPCVIQHLCTLLPFLFSSPLLWMAMQAKKQDWGGEHRLPLPLVQGHEKARNNKEYQDMKDLSLPKKTFKPVTVIVQFRPRDETTWVPGQQANQVRLWHAIEEFFAAASIDPRHQIHATNINKWLHYWYGSTQRSWYTLNYIFGVSPVESFLQCAIYMS